MIQIADSYIPSITIKLRVDRNGNTFYRVQRADRNPAKGFKGDVFMTLRVSGVGTPFDALREYLTTYIETNKPHKGVWDGTWILSDGPYEKCGNQGYLATWVAIKTGLHPFYYN